MSELVAPMLHIMQRRYLTSFPERWHRIPWKSIEILSGLVALIAI